LLPDTFVVFAFALILYFVHDVKEQHWYWITPALVVGVLLWTIAAAALRGYLHFFNTYSKTYGSLGAVTILMLWFYITELSFLVGGQISSTIEHAAADTATGKQRPKSKRLPSTVSSLRRCQTSVRL
jgi:membrane protein